MDSMVLNNFYLFVILVNNDLKIMYYDFGRIRENNGYLTANVI